MKGIFSLLFFLSLVSGAQAQDFANPGKDYGSAPLWVWNTRVTRGLIDTCLRAFKDQAFGGVFVHPRAGLITEYLSPDWFHLWAYATQRAKELGLNIWIYDEDSYPSGFAGGHVPATMPSSYNQGEMLEMDSTGHFKKTFYYTSPWYGGFSYVDLMAPGVTDTFVRLTMRGYERAVGTEFGGTVKGIFSDEPNIEVQYPHSIRWTPKLYGTFAGRWGYRLEDHLSSLLREEGDWRKIRHDYYKTLLQLFIDGWSKPYAAYTTAHHLEWTGHYWEHEWPNPNHVPDNMAMYAWPQRPGIDLLFNQFDEHNVNAQFGNIRAVRELASVANQLGKARNLCETYGGGGWDLRFRDMKRLGDWMFTLGINTLDQHLSFMTITGARKYDYPQSFSYHEPWWPHYKYLNQYFTRLTWALTRGSASGNVLVLEPTTSAWMYAAYDASNPRMMDIGSHFQSFLDHLEVAQVEYELGSEAIIRDHGSVNGMRFVIGARAYDVVVIPPGMENVDSATDALLRRYVAAGGRLLQYEDIQRVEGVALDSLLRYTGWNAVRLDTATFGFEHPWMDPEGFSVAATGGDLHHMRRQVNGAQYVFLSNASMDATCAGSFETRGHSVVRMDLFTGLTTPNPCGISGDSVTVDFQLPPEGSILLEVLPGGTPMAEMKSGAADTVAGAPIQVERPRENTLMIDFCDVRIGDTLLKDKHVYDAADTVFKHYGFGDGDPWNTSIQFKDQTIRRDTFKTGTGFEVTYHIRIGEAVQPAPCRIVVEQPRLWQVSLNGHLLHADGWWLDRAWGAYATGPYLHPGDNQVTVTAKRMSVYAEIEPVYLLGDFNLNPGERGFEVVRADTLSVGSWKDQGMPLYGGSVTYWKGYNLATASGKYVLQLGKWNGTVASVSVNGHDAGIIAFDPNNLDITRWLHPGTNRVEITVTGSLKNLLGPHHNHPPKGLASPWNWRYVQGYPAGKDYDTIDYGLMEDVTLWRTGAVKSP